MNRIIKKLWGIHLDFKQKRVNRWYKSEGMTSRVLDAQTAINTKRNELDLPDRYEMIYKRYVQ